MSIALRYVSLVVLESQESLCNLLRFLVVQHIAQPVRYLKVIRC